MIRALPSLPRLKANGKQKATATAQNQLLRTVARLLLCENWKAFFRFILLPKYYWRCARCATQVLVFGESLRDKFYAPLHIYWTTLPHKMTLYTLLVVGLILLSISSAKPAPTVDHYSRGVVSGSHKNSCIKTPYCMWACFHLYT